MPASPAGPMRREGSDKAVPAGDGDFPEPVKDEIPSPKTVYKPSSRRNLHDDLLDMLVFYPGRDFMRALFGETGSGFSRRAKA